MGGRRQAAVSYNHTELVQLLIASGADVNLGKYVGCNAHGLGSMH
jgi:hypothetical protein